jgi:hypothetical protein
VFYLRVYSGGEALSLDVCSTLGLRWDVLSQDALLMRISNRKRTLGGAGFRDFIML